MKEAAFTIAKQNSALVFIEFQAEWLTENGILFQRLVKDKARMRNAVRSATEVLRVARSAGWPVVHVGNDLRLDPEYQLFAGGKNVLGLRSAIPNAKTWIGEGSEFVEPFVPRRKEFVVSGRSGASALKNSNLDAFLRNNRLDTLFLMGFATHVCVESTLREAHDLGYNAYLVHDACAGFEASQDTYVQQHVVHHFGALMESSELVERINSESGLYVPA